MLRKIVLRRVLGRRLLERLLKAKWIEPTASADGRVYFAENDIHQALRRLQKSGVELNGHVRPMVTAPKKKRVTSTDPLADLCISTDELL
jgi:hypothetical protein